MNIVVDHALVDGVLATRSVVDAAYVDRARDLARLFASRRGQTESERRIPLETIHDLKSSGLLRALQPRRFDGLELDYPTFCRIIEELTPGCASTAWVYAVYAEHAWIAACFPAQAQEDLWGRDPSTLCCSNLAPVGKAAARADGSFELSGRWSFSSGCDHADWALLGAMTEAAGGGRERCLFMVPMAALDVVDDWRVLGLRGTGSKTLTLARTIVPQHRSVAFATLLSGEPPGRKAHPDYYLLRAPRDLFATYTLAGINLALAQKAMDIVSSALRSKVSRGVRISELESTQAKIAESAADIDIARMRLHVGCHYFCRRVRAGEPISTGDILSNRRDVIFLVRRLREAVERLCSAAGAQWVYDTDELQTVLRDIVTASAHRSANWESAMLPYGRFALGLDPGA